MPFIALVKRAVFLPARMHKWIAMPKRIMRALSGRVQNRNDAERRDAPTPESSQFKEPGDLTPIQRIWAERGTLETHIDAAARCGHVPDAYAFSMLVNYEAELAEHKRQLTDAGHQLQASLRRLGALCPIPPEPEPEPLLRPRSRTFKHISDWFPRGDAGSGN